MLFLIVGISMLTKLKSIPDYGDHMTMEEWLECVECGGFIDYDGSGNYATATQMSDKEVVPSDVKKGSIDKSFTHVVWFNK